MTRFSIVKSSALALAVTALITFASSNAQAQIALHGPHGGGVHIGGGGISLHGGGAHWGGGHGGHWGGGHSGHWGGGHWGGGGIVRPYVPAHTWHDTSHYDYHPGRVVRHGNHFDYQPGHYDWHQQGHIDHNHR